MLCPPSPCLCCCFCLLQDLGLELEKRNITQEMRARKRDINDGLESLPGVSSTTTVVPSAELTPRDVSDE